MEKGNMEGARIYAENSIRQHNQAMNYLKLSSRVDAVAARVNTAVQMGRLTKNMSKIVGSMDSVMKTMDVGKISSVMDKFEQQFEDLDLNSKYMENAIDSSTAQTMPEGDVNNLMAQVNLFPFLSLSLPSPPLPTPTCHRLLTSTAWNSSLK